MCRRMQCRYRSILSALILLAGAGPGAAQVRPMQPLLGWGDVRRDFHAVGDGKADDTAALQRGLDNLVSASSARTTLYLPPGTYRITRMLELPRRGGREAIGINIRGAGSAAVVLRWDGPAGGTMLEFGAWYSCLSGLTLDGGGRAAIALKHGPQFVTANELTDLVIRDTGVGIEAGEMPTAGIAETSVRGCRFLRCSVAGISLQNWNSLDWWITDCSFDGCRLGVTNTYGAGNYHVYHCRFHNSTQADLAVGNTGTFNFRRNVSVGSRAFLVAGRIAAAAVITLSENRIYHTKDPASIQVGNLGPVFLLQNLIASRSEVRRGPVVSADQASVISWGNVFTVPGALEPSPRSLLLGDRLVRSSALPRDAGYHLPPEPIPAAVLEVKAGSDGDAIQNALNRAAKLKDPRVLVHLPAGRYPVFHTIVVPKRAGLVIMGEGIPYSTLLEWKGPGSGPVIEGIAPGGWRLYNLAVLAPGAEGVRIPISRGKVALDETQVDGAQDVGFWIEQRGSRGVLLWDVGHSGCGIGVRVEGPPAQGDPVLLWSGASSNNTLSYEVKAGGRLWVRDIWYETNTVPTFLNLKDRGEFVLTTATVAHPRKPGLPGSLIDNFRGRVAFLGVNFTSVGPDGGLAAVRVRGLRAEPVLLLGCHGSGDYLASSPNEAAVRMLCVRYTSGGGAEPIPDAGSLNATILRSILRAAVGGHAPGWSGASAVLRRVFIRNPRVGVHLIGAGTRE
ncbi:MAG: glycosyl hydrolase family 28-related protein [Chthonomonadales bacterium]